VRPSLMSEEGRSQRLVTSDRGPGSHSKIVKYRKGGEIGAKTETNSKGSVKNLAGWGEKYCSVETKGNHRKITHPDQRRRSKRAICEGEGERNVTREAIPFRTHSWLEERRISLNDGGGGGCWYKKDAYKRKKVGDKEIVKVWGSSRRERRRFSYWKRSPSKRRKKTKTKEKKPGTLEGNEKKSSASRRRTVRSRVPSRRLGATQSCVNRGRRGIEKGRPAFWKQKQHDQRKFLKNNGNCQRP